MADTKFKPGQVANPRGRPPLHLALSELVRDGVGGGMPLVAFKLCVFYGDPPDQNGDVLLKDRDGVPYEITLKDRQDAADWLADRGWGKAPAYAPIEDGDPLALDVVEDELARIAQELARKRKAKVARAPAKRALASASENGAASPAR